MHIFGYFFLNYQRFVIIIFFLIAQNICLSKYFCFFSPVSPSFLSFFSLSSFLSLGRGWCQRGVTKHIPFRTKWSRSAKTEVKLPFYLPRSNPFAQNDGRSAKTALKLRFYLCSRLSHKMRVDRQTLNVCRGNPFARNEGHWAKN